VSDAAKNDVTTLFEIASVTKPLANCDDAKPFFDAESKCKRVLDSELVPVAEKRRSSKEAMSSILGTYRMGARKIELTPYEDQIDLRIDWGGPQTPGWLERSDTGELRFVTSRGNSMELTLGPTQDGHAKMIQLMKDKYVYVPVPDNQKFNSTLVQSILGNYVYGNRSLKVTSQRRTGRDRDRLERSKDPGYLSKAENDKLIFAAVTNERLDVVLEKNPNDQVIAIKLGNDTYLKK
jgi:hypothetical protein